MKSPILFQALSEDLERERRRIISGDRSFNEPPNELYTQLFFVFKWDSTCSRLITAIELWEYGVRYWVQKTDELRLRAETESWDWEQRLFGWFFQVWGALHWKDIAKMWDEKFATEWCSPKMLPIYVSLQLVFSTQFQVETFNVIRTIWRHHSSHLQLRWSRGAHNRRR